MPFSRVEMSRAGPSALGILVPPGTRTIVVLRPRALPWDLVPACWEDDPASPPQPCHFGRDEAARVARRLHEDLEVALRAGLCPVQTVGDASERHFQVWLRTPDYVWLMCSRAPGQAYRPAVFSRLEDAQVEAERLSAVFWPPPDRQQEVYFNTQQFEAR